MSRIRAAREEFLETINALRSALVGPRIDGDPIPRLRARTEARPFWGERTFRELGDTLGEGLLATDIDGRIVHANAWCTESLGLSNSELVGRVIGDLLAPSDHAVYRAHLAMLRQGRTDRVELTLRGREARPVPAYVSIRPMFDADGRLEGHALAFARASEGPSTDPVHDQGELRLREIIEHTSSALYVRTTGHALTYVSPQARRLLGCEQGDVPTSWRDILSKHPANRLGFDLACKASKTGLRQRPYELELQRRDGTTLWVEVNETPVVQDGRTTEIVGELTDISERRHLEDLLQVELDLGVAIGAARTLDDAARHVLEAANRIREIDAGWLYVVDADSGDLVLVRQVGLSKAFVAAVARIPASAPRSTLIRGTSRRRLEVVDPAALKEGLCTAMAFPIRYEGRLLACLNMASRQVDAMPAATLRALETVACQLAPIISSVKVRSSLDWSESTLRSLAGSAPAGIGLVRDRTFRWVNDYMVRKTGYPSVELVGRSTRLLYLDDDEFDRVGRELRDQIEQSGIGTVETQWRQRDGSLIDVFVSAAARDGTSVASGLVFTAWDVTERNAAEAERRRLERQMQQAQKLESLGLLAGGVAHDFNNLLHAIMGHASLAGSCLAEGGEAESHLDAIERAAARASDLCRQMLAYSGRGSFVIERIRLGEIVTDLASMLDVSLAKNTELCIDVDDEALPIEADASQMQQVVMNLITNAAEAIGNEVGLIRITVAAAHYGRERLRTEFWQAELQPGTYVRLQVEDTGCGMDAATRERIFEPFFTTKFTGRGLGLAAIQGILRGHGGAIRVVSQVGRGTTVTVLVPEATGRVPGATGRVPAKPVLEHRPRSTDRRGLILLADDELPVRELESMMLESSGFEVVAVEDGLRAVEAFRERPGAFRCVLLDLTMPVMDGEEAFRALREIRSDVPVILCSGFSAQELDHRFNGDRPAAFLEKPFKADALIRAIAEIAPVGS